MVMDCIFATWALRTSLQRLLLEYSLVLGFPFHWFLNLSMLSSSILLSPLAKVNDSCEKRGMWKVVGVYRNPLEFLTSVAKIMHSFDRDELAPRPIALSSSGFWRDLLTGVTRESLSVLSELVRSRSERQFEENERRSSREPILAAVLRQAISLARKGSDRKWLSRCRARR